MLYYDGINVSEGIDVDKTSKSKECDICHHMFVTTGTSQIRGFKFQPDVYNGYHDVLLMSMNLSNISILNIPGADYHCIISGISKSETKEIIQKLDLTEKSRTL